MWRPLSPRCCLPAKASTDREVVSSGGVTTRQRWTKACALLSTAARRAFPRCTSHLVVLQGRGRPSAAGPLISRREATPPLPQAGRIPSLRCPIRCCARARRSRCHRATTLPRRSGRRRSTQHVHETLTKARARDRRLPFISRAGEGRAASALASAASLECPLKRAKARHALCLLGFYAVVLGGAPHSGEKAAAHSPMRGSCQMLRHRRPLRPEVRTLSCSPPGERPTPLSPPRKHRSDHGRQVSSE